METLTVRADQLAPGDIVIGWAETWRNTPDSGPGFKWLLRSVVLEVKPFLEPRSDGRGRIKLTIIKSDGSRYIQDGMYGDIEVVRLRRKGE